MQDLFAWWNLVFLLPLVSGVVLLLLSTLGGLEGLEGADSGGDAVGDAGDLGDPDDAVSGGLDGVGGHAGPDGAAFSGGDAADSASGGSEAGHDGNTGHSPTFGSALRWAGFGTVPITIHLAAFCLFFGIFGMMLNQMWNIEVSPDELLWKSLTAAIAGGFAGMVLFGSTARRFLPMSTAPATGNKDLVGRTGKVIFLVTADEGTVQVRDSGGTVHQVTARTVPSQEPLPSGSAILIVGYDVSRGVFLVEQDPFAENTTA
ncbi:MAG: hypothetical protein OHK0029_18980 [Armatimonadaceae bacterium]